MREPFQADRLTRTASIELNADPPLVFPLFGAFEERKWAEGWQPKIVYPQHETMGEGVVFQTENNNPDPEEQLYSWLVTRYQPQNQLVQYLVWTPNRLWTISVHCAASLNRKTTATITYAFTSLNKKGINLNKKAIEKMYRFELSDWQDAINHYLEHGVMLKTSGGE